MGYLNTWKTICLLVAYLAASSLLPAQAADPPPDLVVLSPSLVEIIFALGAESRIAAVSRYAEWPKAAQSLPRVGGGLDPSIETILAFNPGSILTSGTTLSPPLQQLQRLGLHVEALPSDTIDDIFENIDILGQRLNREQAAQQLIGGLRQEMEALPHLRSPRPTVLVIFGIEGNLTAGAGTFSSEIIQLAGGINLGDSLDGPWPLFSPEMILQADPDIILFSLSHPEEIRAVDHFKQNSKWKGLTAVQTGRIHTVPDSLLAIPGPRFMETVRRLLSLIQPSTHASPPQD